MAPRLSRVLLAVIAYLSCASNVFAQGNSYQLEIQGRVVGYFDDCSGMGTVSEVLENRVIDETGHEKVMKSPGRLETLNVICKRGISSNMDLWTWRALVEQGKVADARAAVDIIILNQNYSPIAQWTLTNAWPSRCEAKLSSAGGSIIEEIEVVSEGVVRVK